MEGRQYKDRCEEQQHELEELKRVHEETQREFDVFRADIGTKDSLIDQLKEKIVEVTR